MRMHCEEQIEMPRVYPGIRDAFLDFTDLQRVVGLCGA